MVIVVIAVMVRSIAMIIAIPAVEAISRSMITAAHPCIADYSENQATAHNANYDY
ncbi:hypothetical protein DSCW_48360 [Desulfosarcina widdelii]|uniref:Uncharacterized protein n=1 Tax=Desulfosarcina widdelii TaxID=947919 RepID=A0A5K7ZB63_9BACT|nr:hypothetical protein DSCW_48360 [Desulfosarcina widdelii]